MVFVAKSIARGNIFNFDNGGDIARVAGLYVCAFVGLNLNQARNALSLVRPWVVNRVAFAQRAGINTEKNEFPNKRITPKFEGQRTKGAVVIGRHFYRLASIGVLTLCRWNVEWTREIIDDRIDQKLDTDFLQRRAADHRHKFVSNCLPANSSF